MIVEDVQIWSGFTSDGELVESSKCALAEIHVYKECIRDVNDTIVEFSAPSHGVGIHFLQPG